MDSLLIAGHTFTSRLWVGTGRYPSLQILLDALTASEADLATVAVRRISLQNHSGDFLDALRRRNLFLLPNTAGCFTAQEAVLTAQLAREALETHWVKLEVIGDRETLYPDGIELLKAAEQLLRDDFIVLPYCSDDPVLCRRLADMGCAAVMPLGSLIGSGLGIRNPDNISLIRAQVEIPLIIDAGLGCAADVAAAMELGADGVLVNTAIAQAERPIAMAEALKWACRAGRLSFTSGRIPRNTFATASS